MKRTIIFVLLFITLSYQIVTTTEQISDDIQNQSSELQFNIIFDGVPYTADTVAIIVIPQEFGNVDGSANLSIFSQPQPAPSAGDIVYTGKSITLTNLFGTFFGVYQIKILNLTNPQFGGTYTFSVTYTNPGGLVHQQNFDVVITSNIITQISLPSDEGTLIPTTLSFQYTAEQALVTSTDYLELYIPPVLDSPYPLLPATTSTTQCHRQSSGGTHNLNCHIKANDQNIIVIEKAFQYIEYIHIFEVVTFYIKDIITPALTKSSPPMLMKQYTINNDLKSQLNFESAIYVPKTIMMKTEISNNINGQKSEHKLLLKPHQILLPNSKIYITWDQQYFIQDQMDYIYFENSNGAILNSQWIDKTSYLQEIELNNQYVLESDIFDIVIKNVTNPEIPGIIVSEFIVGQNQNQQQFKGLFVFQYEGQQIEYTYTQDSLVIDEITNIMVQFNLPSDYVITNGLGTIDIFSQNSQELNLNHPDKIYIHDIESGLQYETQVQLINQQLQLKYDVTTSFTIPQGNTIQFSFKYRNRQYNLCEFLFKITILSNQLTKSYQIKPMYRTDTIPSQQTIIYDLVVDKSEKGSVGNMEFKLKTKTTNFFQRQQKGRIIFSDKFSLDTQQNVEVRINDVPQNQIQQIGNTIFIEDPNFILENQYQNIKISNIKLPRNTQTENPIQYQIENENNCDLEVVLGIQEQATNTIQLYENVKATNSEYSLVNNLIGQLTTLDVSIKTQVHLQSGDNLSIIIPNDIQFGDTNNQSSIISLLGHNFNYEFIGSQTAKITIQQYVPKGATLKFRVDNFKNSYQPGNVSQILYQFSLPNGEIFQNYSDDIGLNFQMQSVNKFEVKLDSNLYGDQTELTIFFKPGQTLLAQSIIEIEIPSQFQYNMFQYQLLEGFLNQQMNVQLVNNKLIISDIPQILEDTNCVIVIHNILNPIPEQTQIQNLNTNQSNFQLLVKHNNSVYQQKDYDITIIYQCNSECQECSQIYSYCTSCQIQYYQLGNQCLSQCPSQTVPKIDSQGKKECLQCQTNQSCLQCDENDVTKCLVCTTGYEIVNGNCQQFCTTEITEVQIEEMIQERMGNNTVQQNQSTDQNQTDKKETVSYEKIIRKDKSLISLYFPFLMFFSAIATIKIQFDSLQYRKMEKSTLYYACFSTFDIILVIPVAIFFFYYQETILGIVTLLTFVSMISLQFIAHKQLQPELESYQLSLKKQRQRDQFSVYRKLVVFNARFFSMFYSKAGSGSIYNLKSKNFTVFSKYQKLILGFAIVNMVQLGIYTYYCFGTGLQELKGDFILIFEQLGLQLVLLFLGCRQYNIVKGLSDQKIYNDHEDINDPENSPTNQQGQELSQHNEINYQKDKIGLKSTAVEIQ